jgi:hypothetical protein
MTVPYIIMDDMRVSPTKGKKLHHFGLFKTGKKYCPTCEEIKDLIHFYRDCCQPSGVTSQCKKCRKKFNYEKYHKRRK